jgi:hypothetical protein
VRARIKAETADLNYFMALLPVYINGYGVIHSIQALASRFRLQPGAGIVAVIFLETPAAHL